jgi:hypothetical protein
MDYQCLRSAKLGSIRTARFYNRPAIVDLNGQKGPRDMKLKMSHSPREAADTARRAPAPPALKIAGAACEAREKMLKRKSKMEGDVPKAREAARKAVHAEIELLDGLAAELLNGEVPVSPRRNGRGFCASSLASNNRLHETSGAKNGTCGISGTFFAIYVTH